MREVEEKRKRLRKQKPQKIGSFIGHHMIPVVLAPKKRHYVIDHHHLSLALYKEGLRDVLVTVVLDLSALDLDAFWTVLDHKSLAYPFDAQGRRRDFADIPKTVMQLKDDPFRSLAGELRRAGGFAKDTTPFSEFLWADFFRRKIKRKAVEADFAVAKRACAWRKPKRPNICRAGAALRPTRDCGDSRQLAGNFAEIWLSAAIFESDQGADSIACSRLTRLSLGHRDGSLREELAAGLDHGKADDKAQRTGPRDFVLRRDWY
jgi:hypothetical protein